MSSTNKFTVTQIKEIFHSGLMKNKRIEIKQGGRPTPLLNIVQVTKSNNRDFKRTFKPDIYHKNSWICGCEDSNRLFCFPCLLFADCKNYPDTEMNWIHSGVVDLSHLSGKVKKHESSQSHLNSVLELSILGKIDIQQQLESTCRQNTKAHNEYVAKNRYVLSKIIDCINFCVVFELAHRDSGESSNRDVFRGLINFSTELDVTLKDHLAKAKVFKGTSREMQNDLLDCMLITCQEHIRKEISTASFVSVIVDEISHISAAFQFVIVLRYVLANGVPVERLWQFVNPSGDDAASIGECIRAALESVLFNPDQVISQSYSSSVDGVQAIVKQHFGNAHFIHCYAHHLYSIVVQSTSQNPQVRMFFSNLNGIVNFFINSPQRVAVLDEVLGKRNPHSTARRWNFQSRPVNTVFVYRTQMIQCMEQIELTSRHSSTINEAGAYRRVLKDPAFSFWLAVFNNIMPHVYGLDNKVQGKTIDIEQTKKYIDNFEIGIAREKENMDKVRMLIEAEISQTSSGKRPRENVHITRTVEAKEACDVIVRQIKSRFSLIPYYSAISLFKTQKFKEYEKQFPSQLLVSTTEIYPCLERYQLRTELEIIYRRQEFRNVHGAIIMIQFIVENNLQTTFSQTYKLLQIISTIPMITDEAERCYSTIKRIKAFLKGTICDERLIALAMLSIEKDMVKNIPNFNEKVIDLFVSKKDWGMDLVRETCN